MTAAVAGDRMPPWLAEPGHRAYVNDYSLTPDEKAVFAAWDDHASRIDLIGFTWMHDETEADVAAITLDPAFGGLQNPPPDYVEFLRTLGLRTESATDKPAWATLRDEAAARGWTDTGMTLICQ